MDKNGVEEIFMTRVTELYLAREAKLRTTEEDEGIMLDLRGVCGTKKDEDDEADNVANDYAKISADEGEMQANIRHPSGNISHKDTNGNTTKKSPRWVLRKKDGKGTISDCGSYEKGEHAKLLSLVPARKPEQAKIGEEIRSCIIQKPAPRLAG